MINLINEIEELNKVHYFILLSLLSMVILYGGSVVLVSDDLYFEYYDGLMSQDAIRDMMTLGRRWTWVVYVLLPFYLSIKFALVAACLCVGTLLAGYSIDIKKLFHVALLAEAVFLISPILRIIWFGMIYVNYGLQDIQEFAPLSLYELFPRNGLEKWLTYPLQLFNAFELAYCFVMAYGLHKITSGRYSKMLWVVFSSYGVGLLLWAVLIVFVSLTFSH